MSKLPTPIIDHMRAQWGLVTRAQILCLGWDPEAVKGWIRSGRLEAVNRGVYRTPGGAAPAEQAVLAAVLRAGTGARAGGHSSCALHGLEGFSLRRPPDVVVPRGRHVSGGGFLVRATLLDPVDLTVVRGVPALAADRGIIEVAAAIDERALRVAIDSGRRTRLITLERLATRAEELGTHHGARIVTRVLASGLMACESEGERGLKRLLAGITPEPEWGITDLVPGRRLDAGWRRALYGLEYDGRDHHVLPTDRDADGVRDLECLASGVLILRVTAGMLRFERQRTRALIAQTLRRRLREVEVLRQGACSKPLPSRPGPNPDGTCTVMGGTQRPSGGMEQPVPAGVPDR